MHLLRLHISRVIWLDSGAHKKGGFMKYWRHVCVISVAIVILAAGFLLFYQERGGTKAEREKKREENVEGLQTASDFPADIQGELYERLYAFALILYQYDTAERRFYEGAEEYMTQAAYGKFCPLGEQEDTQGAVRMRSTLVEANVYVFYESKTEADVILESRFFLTQGMDSMLTQYLKLTLEKRDGQWLITECTIIDTLEE